MYLNNYQNRNELLIEWILQATPAGASILDVGANDGTYCPQVRRIVEHAGVYAGVDPDSQKLSKNPFLSQRFDGTIEAANIPANSFDCAFAIYVLEHVVDDVGFLKAIARVLKPGGSFYFITPNGAHYFAAIAGTLAKLNLQDRVLRLIRPGELVGDYHYPALYRLNTTSKLARLGKQFGLTETEFRYSERLDEFACYFPGPSKAFPWLWERIIQWSGQEARLGNLMGRLTKAQ